MYLSPAPAHIENKLAKGCVTKMHSTTWCILCGVIKQLQKEKHINENKFFVLHTPPNTGMNDAKKCKIVLNKYFCRGREPGV